jgi:hypothetical protein
MLRYTTPILRHTTQSTVLTCAAVFLSLSVPFLSLLDIYCFLILIHLIFASLTLASRVALFSFSRIPLTLFLPSPLLSFSTNICFSVLPYFHITPTYLSPLHHFPRPVLSPRFLHHCPFWFLFFMLYFRDFQAKQKGEQAPDPARASEEIENVLLRKKVFDMLASHATITWIDAPAVAEN